jgi:hypothetical protein
MRREDVDRRDKPSHDDVKAEKARSTKAARLR